MGLAPLLGFAAGFLTSMSFVPQIRKIWKTRSAHDVSRRIFLAVSFGLALWLAYGIILGEWPIILWNSISLVFAVSILFLKHRFG